MHILTACTQSTKLEVPRDMDTYYGNLEVGQTLPVRLGGRDFPRLPKRLAEYVEMVIRKCVYTRWKVQNKQGHGS